MDHQFLTPSTVGSPTEQTFVLLQERLGHAEKEALELSKKLVHYGFKRLPAEKPDVETSYISSNPNGNVSKFLKNVSSENHGNNMVSRLCKMESIIESLRSGMRSLELEKSTTTTQLLHEKNQLQENYSKEFKELQKKLEEQKRLLVSHEEAKALLDKQISKLKRDAVKRIEMQKVLVEKLKEKDIELNAYQNKLTEVSKEISNERSSKKKTEENHSSMLLKISEMEASIETERLSVAKLTSNCETSTNDALMAREEFEKEYKCRMRLENILSAQEKELETANNKLRALSEESSFLQKKANGLEENFMAVSMKTDKMRVAFDATASENQRLKESLKIAAVDNHALVTQSKEALTREQTKIQNALSQQNKILDAAKKTLLQELDYQRKQTEAAENEKLELTNKLNEYQTKNNEYDFKMKMTEQSHAMEISRLKTSLSSSEKMKEELQKQLSATEKEICNRNNVLLNEKASFMQANHKLENKFKELSEHCQKIEQEKVELSDKISWLSMTQKSQQNIENKFSEMVSEKNTLSYEKGVLLSKVESLQEEAVGLKTVKEDYVDVKKTCKNLEGSLNEMKKLKLNAEAELHDMLTAFQNVNGELESHKDKLSKADKDVKQLIKSRDKALQEVEKLVEHIQTTSKQYKEEKNTLLSRITLNEKQRDNMSETFESLMVTNDSLQKELQMLQMKMGRKDVEMEALYSKRTDNESVVSELKVELDTLTLKLNNMSQTDHEQLETVKSKLHLEQKEHKKLQTICELLNEDKKRLKLKLIEIKSELKQKEGDLKRYIDARHNDTNTQKEKLNKDIDVLKQEHNKEIKKLKHQINVLNLTSKKKEKQNSEKQDKLMVLTDQLGILETDKAMYLENNNEQASLLETFMSQISDLQNELSSIVNAQNETTLKLREKESFLESEKRKRKEIQLKYKTLLRKHAEFEVQRKENPLETYHSSLDHSNDRLQFIHKEKLHTKDVLKRYQIEMEKNEKKLEDLSDELQLDFMQQNRKIRTIKS